MESRPAERPLTVEELGSMGRDEFVGVLGHVFENSPWVAERAWEKRPFGSLEELWSAMCEAVRTAGRERQLALIEAHPELGGRRLDKGELSASSADEQQRLGLHRLTPDQRSRLVELGAEYRRRFGFVCIVCVREHESVESVVDAIERRLGSTREAEAEANIEEICKIARFRLGIGAAPAAGRPPGIDPGSAPSIGTGPAPKETRSTPT
jgi:2-oxo-4-hydroxy-4-carboxy-5-ureidoimidazoline decarboxylase